MEMHSVDCPMQAFTLKHVNPPDYHAHRLDSDAAYSPEGIVLPSLSGQLLIEAIPRQEPGDIKYCTRREVGQASFRPKMVVCRVECAS